jgi:hypothetical protein
MMNKHIDNSHITGQGGNTMTINIEKKLAAMIILVIVLINSGVAQANIAASSGKAAGRVLTSVEYRELAAFAAHSEGAAARLIQSLGEEGAEAMLKNLSPAAKDMLVRNGERGADFFVKAGPAAEPLILKYGDDILRVFESTGANTASWVAKYGDDGVRAANRFGVTTTEGLINRAGMESLPVALQVGHPAVAILKRNPEALHLFQTAIREGSEKPLLEAIERGGDRFFQFAQRNWKGIGVASLCTAFIAAPEAFTEPGFKAVKDVGKSAIESGADLLKEVVKTVAKNTSDAIANPKSFAGGVLTFAVIISLGLGGVWMVLRHFKGNQVRKAMWSKS